MKTALTPILPKKKWSAADDQHLTEATANGQSIGQIAATMGCTPKSIQNRMKYLELTYVKGERDKVHAAEQDALIVQLLKEGLTYDGIAAKMGVARGVISGRIYRFHGRPVADEIATLRRSHHGMGANVSTRYVKPAPGEDVGLKKPKYVSDPVVAKMLLSEPRPDEPASLQLSHADLESRNCRWIHGDPKQRHHYCGHTVKQGSTFCDFHHKVCYTPYVRKTLPQVTHVTVADPERVLQLLRRS